MNSTHAPFTSETKSAYVPMTSLDIVFCSPVEKHKTAHFTTRLSGLKALRPVDNVISKEHSHMSSLDALHCLPAAATATVLQS